MKIRKNKIALFILVIAFCACKQKAIPEIKRITPKQIESLKYPEFLEYPEFNINADEVIYENGKIKALNDYTGKSKKEFDGQVLLVWEQGLLKQEIRKYFYEEATKIDTLNYKQVAPDTLRAIGGRRYPTTAIILDSLHRIVGRIEYGNSFDPGFIIDYCRFTRDKKGNKKEAVGISGEVDQEGYKGIYDYLAFDAYGNWTKRRGRGESKDYGLEDLHPFYTGKKKEPFLSFPVKFSAKPYEYIEERVIEYKEEGNWWDFIL